MVGARRGATAACLPPGPAVDRRGRASRGRALLLAAHLGCRGDGDRRVARPDDSGRRDGDRHPPDVRSRRPQTRRPARQRGGAEVLPCLGGVDRGDAAGDLARLRRGRVRAVIEVGLALTIVGLAFKVAAVPFQAWVPDTYVGAPIPVAAYLSVVSKAAGLAGIAIVLVGFGPAMADTWRVFVAVAAALTMTVGNLAALRQRHLVRLLAWSSVAQAGYLLVPIAAAGGSDVGDDLAALQAYALMYAIVNIGAFAVVVAVSAGGAVGGGDVTGRGRRQP